jgi:NAD(P)-dependent dehydrogenase (short-subunit alcohol dehydrogenase family)
MESFQDKVVVITGAGGGLGRAHALEFARRGARVVVNDLGGSADGSGQSDMADQVVAEIRASGGVAIANKASVADRAGAKSIIDDAVSEFGTIDVLINNAGILRDKSFKNLDLDDWDLVINVHLNGTAYVTHAAWPIMYAKNYGRIVLTSSTSGIFGNFGQSNYGAAKMGMVGLMNVLALEGASHNIKVNTLAPAAATRLTNTIPGRDENLDQPDPERASHLVTPAVLYMASDHAPTGRIFQAGNGRFSLAAIYSNEGVIQGKDADYERFLAAEDEILDLSQAREGWWRRRVQANPSDNS